MRHLVVLCIALSVVTFRASDAFAKNATVVIHGNHWSISRIQGICAQQGGEFYQKGDNYGCSEDCKGGTCSVSCQGGSKGGQCVGSVPVPRLAPGHKYRVPA
jgi:hypothetical protein